MQDRSVIMAINLQIRGKIPFLPRRRRAAATRRSWQTSKGLSGSITVCWRICGSRGHGRIPIIWTSSTAFPVWTVPNCRPAVWPESPTERLSWMRRSWRLRIWRRWRRRGAVRAVSQAGQPCGRIPWRRPRSAAWRRRQARATASCSTITGTAGIILTFSAEKVEGS